MVSKEKERERETYFFMLASLDQPCKVPLDNIAILDHHGVGKSKKCIGLMSEISNVIQICQSLQILVLSFLERSQIVVLSKKVDRKEVVAFVY